MSGFNSRSLFTEQDEARSLADRLMRSDSCEEVVELLKNAGYWDDDKAWRYLGDNPHNWSTIGNQQSEAVASLVEKIINGVDARLMNACLEQGIDPESSKTPTSVRGAVAQFFEDGLSSKYYGLLRDWSDSRLRREDRKLTLAASGNSGNAGKPCISIADQGEGQTPDDFPATFLSLQHGNKNKIRFVQGKYNMGGTGALNFCASSHRLQLIIARRNPALLGNASPARDSHWGFTIVRREEPKPNEKMSTFTYLAPIEVSKGRDGKVLSFFDEVWPIFPDGDDAYSRMSEYGTLIKLYEYDCDGARTNIVTTGNALFHRLDLAMPELALPVRIYECRKSTKSTREGTLTGLVSRLEKDKIDALEENFPYHCELHQKGKSVKVKIYLFKQNKGKHYRNSNSGIVFTVNGQTHATLPVRTFSSKNVGLSYLSESLFVVLDCSNYEGLALEELFMNSRDRLRDSVLAENLKKDLYKLLAADSTLKRLNNERREEQIKDALKDDRPLSEIIEKLVNKDQALAKLLNTGFQITSPFSGGTEPPKLYEGRQFPTFFHFEKKSHGEMLEREAELGREVRLAFETDAENEYFSRSNDPGELTVLLNGQEFGEEGGYRRGQLRDGFCNVHIELPGNLEVGKTVNISVQVDDIDTNNPFTSIAKLTIIKKREHRDEPKPPRKKAGLSIPTIKKVRKDEWEKHSFTRETALKIMTSVEPTNSKRSGYDFYVNVENIYLRDEQKKSKISSEILETKFTYALVIFTMALLRDSAELVNDDSESQNEQDIESIVEGFTKSLARVLLPFLNSLAELSEDEIFEEDS